MTPHRSFPSSLAPLLGALCLAACGGGSAEAPGASVPHTAPAATPPGVTAVVTSDRSVALRWTDSAGATGWRVERKATGTAAYTEVTTLPAASREWLDDGLQPDTAYDYRITALGANVAGDAGARTGTADDAPLTSALAAPGDVLVEGVVGPAGGRVQTGDGSVVVELPAGTFAAATPVRIRRLPNTLAPVLEAPADDGVAIEFGAPPQKAPLLTLGWSAEHDTEADAMQAALQRTDGSWLVLPQHARDAAQRRFTTPLPVPGTAGAVGQGAINGGQATKRATRQQAEVTTTLRIVRVLQTVLRPQRAAVPVGRTLEFKPWSIVLAQEQFCHLDVCVPAPVVQPRALPILNQKPGYERTWAVQGTTGGDAVHGTVVPNPTHGAVYTAPASKPATNPVMLGFTTRHVASGRSTTLRTTVRVTAPQWTGATRGLLSAPPPEGTLAFWFGVANATWKLTSSTATEDRYEAADGVQRIEVENRGCSGTAAPASAPMPPAVLVIDRSTSPARYTLDVGSTWNTQITGTCPDGTATVPMQVPGRLQASGTVSADGRRIEGERTSGSLRWEWFLSLGD
jgi:hypothetical protein